MRKGFVCVLAAIALLQNASAFAQTAEDLFMQARNMEMVSGDIKGAIRIYTAIANDSGASRQLVAQARQRLAVLAPNKDPVKLGLPFTTDNFSFALSPDGTKLVYSVAYAEQGQLWLCDISTGDAAPIPGATLERSILSLALPFWSPDGRSIAYFSGGKLMRIGVDGGKARVLADAPGTTGGSWTGNTIIYNGKSDSERPGQFHIVRTDGEVAPTVIGMGGQQPSFLPDGKHFLFFRITDMEAYRNGRAAASLRIGSTDGRVVKNLPVPAYAGAFVAPDILLYVVQQGLFAQRLDMSTFELLGESWRITTDKVAFGVGSGTGKRAFAVSQSGRVAFSSSEHAVPRQLVWMDREGKQVGAGRPMDLDSPVNVRVSPDGRRILVTREGSQRAFVLEEGLKDKPLDGVSGIWGPQGDIVLSQGTSSSTYANLVLFSRTDDNWQKLAELRPVPFTEVPEDWSRDGRYLLYRVLDQGDLWVMDMKGGAPARSLVALSGQATRARLAPGGQWFAYQSNDQGTDGARRMEIFVQPLSGTVKDRVQVSTAGGTSAAWSSDGTRLYYLSLNYDLMEVEVSIAADGGIKPGKPRVLFQVPPGSEFDVHPDGNRFLVNRFAAREKFRVTVLPGVDR